MTGKPATGRDTYVIGVMRRDNLETDELAVYPSALNFL
jgi:hypothetical protein